MANSTPHFIKRAMIIRFFMGASLGFLVSWFARYTLTMYSPAIASQTLNAFLAEPTPQLPWHFYLICIGAFAVMGLILGFKKGLNDHKRHKNSQTNAYRPTVFTQAFHHHKLKIAWGALLGLFVSVTVVPFIADLISYPLMDQITNFLGTETGFIVDAVLAGAFLGFVLTVLLSTYDSMYPENFHAHESTADLEAQIRKLQQKNQALTAQVNQLSNQSRQAQQPTGGAAATTGGASAMAATAQAVVPPSSAQTGQQQPAPGSATQQPDRR